MIVKLYASTIAKLDKKMTSLHFFLLISSKRRRKFSSEAKDMNEYLIVKIEEEHENLYIEG